MNAATAGWRQRLAQELPGRLLRPLGYLPRAASVQSCVTLCNRIFATALAKGELSFLERRVLRIRVDDAGMDLTLGAERNRLISLPAAQRTDVSICGNAHDFLLLASRREDPDTLFFQRRLRLEGDTVLGLHLKNFLDAWEPPAGVRLIQQFTAAVLERMEG